MDLELFQIILPEIIIYGPHLIHWREKYILITTCSIILLIHSLNYFSEVSDRLSKLKTRTIKFDALLNEINKDSDKVWASMIDK